MGGGTAGILSGFPEKRFIPRWAAAPPPLLGAHREEGLDVKEILSSALALCWGATVLG